MASVAHRRPVRLFLDAGVLIDGFFNRWGTCKGVLVLVTLRTHFRAVIADSIADEVMRAVKIKTESLTATDAGIIRNGFDKWFDIARPERIPWPSEEDLLRHAGLLSVVRHRNDMPSVVAAILARPDWVLSTNTDHWNGALATRTGLRIATPLGFLSSLEPS